MKKILSILALAVLILIAWQPQIQAGEITDVTMASGPYFRERLPFSATGMSERQIEDSLVSWFFGCGQASISWNI